VNPDAADLTALRDLRQAGFNRASLGVQSLCDRELALMGRRHTAAEALRAFDRLRAAGFDNVSVDILAGFPGQSLASLDATLRSIIGLAAEHLSIYLLELKDGTKLQTEISSGRIAALDDDLAADMYEQFTCQAIAAGYSHYEISNFALPGRRSKHNLKYWLDAVYRGFGAAAAGMTGRRRYANHGDLEVYHRAVNADRLPLAVDAELTPSARFWDALIMGLRLVEGVDLGALGRRYHVDAEAIVVQSVSDLIAAGLLEREGARLRFTARGLLLSNVVFSRWV
jgi:oxygen-independent coproporphyrinogen-3 oxidase